MKKKLISIIGISIVLCICALAVITSNRQLQTVQVNSNSTLSNQKIGWGIKRANNHEQPDVGSANKVILDEYEGIAIGNKEDKYVYLTFDEGYEAGYTEKILETLKQNEVTATFFITAHYLNTQTDLVKKMIENGNTIGNHIPVNSMYH